MITVFTPTYNRAYTLKKLYDSLCRQTDKDFEWLVVDDGSSDNTEELIAVFQKQERILIRYFKVENGGKHRAINFAVKCAYGSAFFIVDSDDFLPETSISTVKHYFSQIEYDDRFAGVSGFRMFKNGEKIGGGIYDSVDADMISIREKYHVKGDMAEVFKTSVLSEYPFPTFVGEKFISEEVVWAQIAQKYLMRYFYEGIYVCEYLEDGLTKSIRRQFRNSPLGTMFTYASYLRQNRSFKTKFLNAINYWRYTWQYPNKRLKDFCPPAWAYLLCPLGVLFYYIDINKEK